MGQRHQIFIKIANPLKHASTSDKAITAKMKTLFGSGDYTILPFHNQWLYGRTALQVCLNVLNHTSQFERETLVSTKAWDGNNSPFTPNGMKYQFSDPDKLIAAIAFIQNYIPTSTDFIETGIGGGWYLGYEEPEMREDFRRGDNNDGITIIDVIENKYCFMNINEWNGREKDERVHSASDLPYLTPVSAHDYVTAYYGETVATTNKYYIERAKEAGKKPETVSAESRKVNKKLVKQFAKYQVLTMDEVLTMFPLVKKELSEKDLVVAE